jgi:NAD(P)-dependent dehydrogenase (short-subunit alcohol dehydrogenase family)
MKRLENKVAVITGGNSGIGLATAQLFVKEGAKVIVNARNAQRYHESSYLVEEGIRVIQADVTVKEELKDFFAQVNKEFGKIDIVFANAGQGKIRPLEMIDDEHIDAIFNTNVKGVINTVQSALPFFNDEAKVILNTSVVNVKGMPGLSVYSATKAAVRSLTRSFAAELLPKGIRVNAVSPGPIETPIFSKMDLPEDQQKEFANNVVSSVPMGRTGKSEEIASAVLFLATNDSSYINAFEIAVDGGMTQI